MSLRGRSRRPRANYYDKLDVVARRRPRREPAVRAARGRGAAGGAARLPAAALKKGIDAFLLESIFRQVLWPEHLQLPVTENNERAALEDVRRPLRRRARRAERGLRSSDRRPRRGGAGRARRRARVDPLRRAPRAPRRGRFDAQLELRRRRSSTTRSESLRSLNRDPIGTARTSTRSAPPAARTRIMIFSAPASPFTAHGIERAAVKSWRSTRSYTVTRREKCSTWPRRRPSRAESLVRSDRVAMVATTTPPPWPSSRSSPRPGRRRRRCGASAGNWSARLRRRAPSPTATLRAGACAPASPGAGEALLRGGHADPRDARRGGRRRRVRARRGRGGDRRGPQVDVHVHEGVAHSARCTSPICRTPRRGCRPSSATRCTPRSRRAGRARPAASSPTSSRVYDSLVLKYDASRGGTRTAAAPRRRADLGEHRAQRRRAYAGRRSSARSRAREDGGGDGGGGGGDDGVLRRRKRVATRWSTRAARATPATRSPSGGCSSSHPCEARRAARAAPVGSRWRSGAPAASTRRTPPSRRGSRRGTTDHERPTASPACIS